MKIITVLAAAVILQGCDQVAYRAVGLAPKPAQRQDHIDVTAVATVTLAGPRDRVERILDLIVERDPSVMTLVELREK